jgi:segregation and condensation protein B
MPEPIDIVEGLLFASDTPLEAERIREVLDLQSADDARSLVAALRERYEGEARALQIAEVAGGYRMVTRAEVAPWLVRLARTRTRVRLSRAALEALAIVAYKQPVSRPEIDAVRGVNSDGVLDNLLERRLVRIAGRKDAPGRPFLFETTREFLVAFGLRDRDDLPRVEGDLALPDLGAGDASADATDPPDPTDPTDSTDPPDPTDHAEPADGQAEAEQDPGPGGSDLPAGR